MKQLERRADAYCRRVRAKLPFAGKSRRDYLTHMRQDVLGYLSNHPWAKQEELEEVFGSPEDIALSFLSELSYPEIMDRIRARNRAVRLVGAAVAAALLLLIVTIVYMLIRNRQDMDGYFVVTQAARTVRVGRFL